MSALQLKVSGADGLNFEAHVLDVGSFDNIETV